MEERNFLDIAREKLKGQPKAAFIQAIGYWGAPVGRRTDRGDSMKIYAAAKLERSGAMLFIQGARNGNWRINVPVIDGLGVRDMLGGNGCGYIVKKAGSVDGYDIMEISFGGQNCFPDEFVIRLDTAEKSFYDNNNGANYRVPPYGYAFNVE
jgi:hypothetical protein